jgi:predicted amidophosphoribosyltransferase
LPDVVLRAAGRLSCGLFSVVFPDDCRICAQPLREISRIPVCAACLSEPQPLIAEYFCASCRAPFLNARPLDETGRCALCRLGLAGFDAVYSYGSYEGTLRKLIHLFKYGQIRPLARPFGDLLSRVVPREQRFDCVVPIPLHWRRRWERGFNQSELLAREIARRSRGAVADHPPNPIGTGKQPIGLIHSAGGNQFPNPRTRYRFAFNYHWLDHFQGNIF